MPHGEQIHGSPSTSSTQRRPKKVSYRRVGATSFVDETLFAKDKLKKSKHVIADASLIPTSDLFPKPPRKPEVVTLYTRDMVRNLIVPRQDPSGGSIVLSCTDFQRVREEARVRSKAEKEADAAAAKAMREAEIEASERRRQTLKEHDVVREKKYHALNDLDQERQSLRERLRAKATQHQLEQDDDIKYLCKVMNNAKVQAMRDAQITEKKEIKKEMTEEELKLDLMMEVERQNAIRRQEELDRKRHDEQLIGAAALIDQIKEIDQDRLNAIEERDYENRQMLHYLDKQLEEDQANLEREKTAKLQFRAELHKANSELLARKAIRKDQERLEDLKVVEFQKRKAEREAAMEREQQRIRREKERESARLCAEEKRDRNEANEREALRAKRAQDDQEREWRRKEAEAERLKFEESQDMMRAHEEQLAIKKFHLAREMQHDHKEFDREVKMRADQIALENKRNMEKRMATVGNAEYLRRQIKQKERQQVMERNRFFEEGSRMREEERMRKMNLEAIKQQKLNELREAGVPAKYLSTCERLANLPQHSVI